MRRLNKAGFSLIESLVTTVILAFLMTGVFFAFDYGNRAFKESNSKQNAQAELTKAYLRLRQDLRQTHFRSCSIVEREVLVAGETLRRDALVMGGLQDWKDPVSFDEINGVPKWDRYVLYYATTDGQLIRAKLDPPKDPSRPDFSPAPYFQFDAATQRRDDPTTNDLTIQSGFNIVSRRLHLFEARLDSSSNRVFVNCLVKQRVGREVESGQIKFDIFPQNTWPKE